MTESVEIEKLESFVGKKIRVQGIVDDIQDHGGLIFLEISDFLYSLSVSSYNISRRIIAL